jgi:2-amino-4-hydroxy-6-hydroxymethyldihydropteridine diphosphokinase
VGPPSAGSADSPVRAFLGLGSNIGDRRGTLRQAVAAIPDVVAVSSLYETEPVGGVEQDAFYNIVVEVATSLSPRELLALCRSLEREAGRRRIVRWGPRTLDVDVLLYGSAQIDDPELVVPHPRMTERNFVMVPLLEIAPDLATHRLLAGYNPASSIGDVTSIGSL